MPAGLEFAFESCKRHHQRAWRIRQWQSPVGRAPRCGSVAFGIDDQDHAADLAGRLDAAQSGRGQKLAAKPPSLLAQICCEACKAKAGDIMLCQAAANNLWSLLVGESCWRQTVEAVDRLTVAVVNRQKVLAPPCSWL